MIWYPVVFVISLVGQPYLYIDKHGYYNREECVNEAQASAELIEPYSKYLVVSCSSIPGKPI